MSSLPYDSSPGPIIADQRVHLMRRLLRRAVDHYRLALAFTEEVDDAMPEPFRLDARGRDAAVEAEGECGAWWRLYIQAEEVFWSAELALSTMIFNISDDLSPPDRRTGAPLAGATFVERAVEVENVLYTCVSDPAAYEEGKSVILATLSRDRIIGLD
jgi:hypothetical protein